MRQEVPQRYRRDTPRQAASLRVTLVQAPHRVATVTHHGPSSSRDGPNFAVLVVHGVVPATLAPRKSHSFVLSGKRSHRLAAQRSHRLAARAHDAPSFRQ
jgi:hypothetical protein